jgi:hypothetical protein
MHIKRYIGFSYSNYYPAGGFHDFTATSDDLDECIALTTDHVYNVSQWHIVDMFTLQIVAYGKFIRLARIQKVQHPSGLKTSLPNPLTGGTTKASTSKPYYTTAVSVDEYPSIQPTTI